jgi:hypothetical protein
MAGAVSAAVAPGSVGVAAARVFPLGCPAVSVFRAGLPLAGSVLNPLKRPNQSSKRGLCLRGSCPV